MWQLAAQEQGRLEQQALDRFAPLLQRIAAAVEDLSLRPELEKALSDLEEKGWMLRGPAQRIWEGERDAAMLTVGLDAEDAALVRRMLELVDHG